MREELDEFFGDEDYTVGEKGVSFDRVTWSGRKYKVTAWWNFMIVKEDGHIEIMSQTKFKRLYVEEYL